METPTASAICRRCEAFGGAPSFHIRANVEFGSPILAAQEYGFSCPMSTASLALNPGSTSSEFLGSDSEANSEVAAIVPNTKTPQ